MGIAICDFACCESCDFGLLAILIIFTFLI